MRTIPGRTSGLGTSESASTSGPPVCVNTIAFISPSVLDEIHLAAPEHAMNRWPRVDPSGRTIAVGRSRVRTVDLPSDVRLPRVLVRQQGLAGIREHDPPGLQHVTVVG